ncbi:MAG: hypothetical protein LBP80_04215 [Treponema sp.]|jgi:hypothetical protein|nr:hypothetical protein [Treponema sp.]
MKTYRLWCLAAALLPLLCTCNFEPEEHESKYDEAPRLTVTITDLPAGSFSSGSAIYIRFENTVTKREVQGNAPIGNDGRAVISLHLPTGIPYKAVQAGKADVFILENNKTDKPLYKTKETVPFERHAVNVSISFTEFESVPQ